VAGHVLHRNVLHLKQADPQHLYPADLRQRKQAARPAPVGSPTSQREEEEAPQANRQLLLELLLVKLLQLLASLLPGYRSDRLLPCHRPLFRTLASSSSSQASRAGRQLLRPDQLSHSKTRLPPLSLLPPLRWSTSTSCWEFSRARAAAVANASLLPAQVEASQLKQPCPSETPRDSPCFRPKTSKQGSTSPNPVLQSCLFFIPILKLVMPI